jgi:hypothetical protein
MVSSNGQIIQQAPALYAPPVQDLQGSALEAASTKTIASNAALAATAKAMGAGQKGSSRKRSRNHRVKKGGASTLQANAVNIPEAGTIRGVSAMKNHLMNVDNLNQIRADAAYDKLGNSQPYDPTPAKGGRRTKRKHTQRHGRRDNRTNRRRYRKSFTHSRRSRRSLF